MTQRPRPLQWLRSVRPICLGVAALAALSTCASPPPPPPSVLREDVEALGIYTDLVDSGLLPRGIPRAGTTPLDRPSSRVWRALQRLAAAAPEERDEARTRLSEALATTGYTAEVCFRTPEPGAKVLVRPLSARRSVTVGYTNSPDAYDLTLGLYDVWTTRDGQITDERRSHPVTRRSMLIDLEGDASAIAACR